MIGSIINYLYIMDFGLTNTITRFYSQRIALNDEEGKENTLAIGSIIYGVLSLLVIIIGVVLYNTIDIFYADSLTFTEIAVARKMLVFLIFNTAFTILTKSIIAAVTSHEKFIFLRLLQIMRSTFQPICVILILSIRAEAMVIVQVQVAVNVIATIVTIWYAFKRVGIRIKLHNFNLKLVKSMMGFSVFVFLQMLLDLLIWRTGYLVLGAMVGTAIVAVFSIAIQLNIYYMDFAIAISNVLFPKISRIATDNEDMTELNEIFIKLGRLQFSVLGLILSGFIIFGRAFLMLWVGEAFMLVYPMTIVIMIPYTFDLIENAGVLILQAKNLHKNRSLIFVGVAIINIILTIVLTRFFGGFGAAAAMGISIFIGHGVAINIYYMKIQINVINFFKKLKSLFFSLLVISIIGFVFTTWVSLDAWLTLGIGIITYIVLYLAIFWQIGFNSYEKGLIKSMLGKLTSFSRRTSI